MKRQHLASRPPDEWARQKVHSGGVGGYSEKAMRAAHEAKVGLTPLTVRCSFCRWWRHRPAAEAIGLQAAHMAEAHPELLPYRKGRRRRERERAMELARRRGADAAKRDAA